MPNQNKNPHAGTGYVFAEIDLGPHGTVKIEDDGASDTDVRLVVNGPNNPLTDRLVGPWAKYRRDNGDEKFEETLHNALGWNDDEDSGDGSVLDHGVAFKCDDCNRTWAGRRNQNPGSGPDICPECGDDE